MHSAKHLSDALGWIERNVPDGIRIVAQAMSETSTPINKEADVVIGLSPRKPCGCPPGYVCPRCIDSYRRG